MVLPLLLSRASSFSVRSRAIRPLHQAWQPFLPFGHIGVGSKLRFFSDLAATKLPHTALGNLTRPFEVTAPYQPSGDQPEAIQQLIKQLDEGDQFSILQGITGTGKTFVMSHVICNTNKPTLVLCHNKTLAAQLARELRSFLKNNAVELFVSYYNYYKPEAYIETLGKYVAKKSSVNDDIDALRHRATRALLERRDVVIVASVSCIFGLGLPTDYLEASTKIDLGDVFHTLDLIKQMESMLYKRPDDPIEMLRGDYQLAAGPGGRVLSFWPPYEKFPMTITLSPLGDTLRVTSIHGHRSNEAKYNVDSIRIFPAKHNVISEDRLEDACLAIETEMRERVQELTHLGKYVEAQRLQQRVSNDLLMLRETGFCTGVENYSRYFANRAAGAPPDTLIDYFKMAGDGKWLLVVDESHATLPQLKTMYAGNKARKEKLVKHGYLLPSAFDHRPLKDEEVWDQVDQVVFMSATPAKTELARAHRPPVEMIIRPTFVCDPVIEVRPSKGQLNDLVTEIRVRSSRNERTLAMAITKKDAEDLAAFLTSQGTLATFIHSDLSTHERSEAIKALQSGEVDCLVGVNLLREGLDLPQVSLVAILNADSAGFLRSNTALLQTVGRAARNINGAAIFYADKVTEGMQLTIDDTKRRRETQLAYNEKFGQKSTSAEGSTIMSIFDLLRDEIEDEQSLESVGRRDGFIAPVKTLQDMERIEIPLPSSNKRIEVVTDHIPSKPGVYLWKDSTGNILYIGKAKRLRSRVKSYLSSNINHSSRIVTMISKAAAVEFVLTPSDRDALILESNFIKHYQPPYNVLLKDDTEYPYICASIGDEFPRFFASPRRQDGEKALKYRYFGPYPHYKEINAVLETIEENYDLRANSFAARHGDFTKQEYSDLFLRAMFEVFESSTDNTLKSMRSEYEEAKLLFKCVENTCRDVVAVGRTENDEKSAVVHIIQLREGLVAGRFSYSCELSSGLTTEEDIGAVIQMVLERQHYPSGGESGGSRFSFFPDEILLQSRIESDIDLTKSLQVARAIVEPNRTGRIKIRTIASRGARKETDARAMEFAVSNANQAALERQQDNTSGATKTSLDGTAMKELTSMLSLDKPPRRIECYDISHTQGEVAVGSRVVFIDGKPSPTLYRTFNIKASEGNDDYASLEEVLERRFRHVWSMGSGALVQDGDPWALPDLVVIDGGIGQLGAAIKGMAKANVFPCRLPPSGDHELTKVNGDIIEEEVIAVELNGDTSAEVSMRSTYVPICSLAKSKELIFLPGSSFPVNGSPDSPGLLLIRSLRDESHRFALHAHRRRRTINAHAN